MLKIGILGAGTVGSGVVKILTEKKEKFESKLGYSIEIKSIAVKNLNKERPDYFNGIKITDNCEEIVNDPEINLIVELIGGSNPAGQLILKAIENGKHIVTANKEVLAKYGKEIYHKAKEKNLLIFSEGSVAGGIPIIQTLKRDLIANQINEIMGIINGTTNYILSEMTQKKRDFSDVLKEAQQLGFAEADPSSDVDAFDATYKLSILSSIIFESHVDLEKVYREGITKISLRDIEHADKLGYVIKLLAIAKRNNNDTFEIRVHPTMIPSSHPLAAVSGSYNAIWVNGDSVGNLMLYGRGAGQLPTASSVTADIINLASEMNMSKNISYSLDKEANISPIKEITSKYYLRVQTTDKPGVIGIIGKDLGDSNVSISSLWQADTNGKRAEIVIITHPVKEENLNKAIELLKKSEGIEEISNIIRVEDTL